LAEKEFEHVRELKMAKLEGENKAREAVLTATQQHQRDSLHQQQQMKQQQQVQLTTNPKYKELEDENEDLKKKARRQKDEIEDLELKIAKLQQHQNQQSVHQQQQQQMPQQQQQNQNQNVDLAIAKLREQITKLQKEKAALQMQLMRRDEQLKEFESTYVNKMLEEVNALRLARDKALLDCTRLTNDIQQLQQQLRGETQIRNSLADRIDSNAAHVSTVHGSLRAVMLEASNREQALEAQISKLQKELQNAVQERNRIEESATSMESNLFNSTTKSLVFVEGQISKLLQSLLLLLEAVRDKPSEKLESIMPLVVSCVESATQSVQMVKSELGFVAASSGSGDNNNSQLQQQQQRQQLQSLSRQHQLQFSSLSKENDNPPIAQPTTSMSSISGGKHNNNNSNNIWIPSPVNRTTSSVPLPSTSQLFAEAANSIRRR
jgi:DNA repair exonuclease SbcCD ATPase subunit